MKNLLPTIKVYDIDYSFIIKNYLNPEMWGKTWTLFQYKTFVATLQLDYIHCMDEKVLFRVTVKDTSPDNKYRYTWGNNEDKKAWYSATYSLKINDINFLKRETNSRIFDCIQKLEEYNIYASEECQFLEDKYENETEILTRIAEDFLDNNNIENEDIREAYIDAYINKNAKLDTYKTKLVEEMQYTIFPDLYLFFANATKDEKVIRHWEKVLEENSCLEEIKNEISEFLDYMETDDFEKDSISCLEEI